MDLTWNIVWKSAFIVLFGILMLRFSGRRSISQMTAATTVIMISIGNLLANGIIEKAVWRASATVGLFLLILMLVEYLESRIRWVERMFSGKSVTVLEDGVIKEDQLRKLRMPKEQFLMRLRQQGLNVSDLKTATIEVNGKIGYEWMRHAKPLTVGDMEELLATYCGKEQQGRSPD